MSNTKNASPAQHQYPHNNLEDRTIPNVSLDQLNCPEMHQLIENVLQEDHIGQGQCQSIGNDAGIGTEFSKGHIAEQNTTTIQERVAAESQLPNA